MFVQYEYHIRTYLTFKEHITRKTKLAWYQLSLLKKVKPFLPEIDFSTAVWPLVILLDLFKQS